MVSRELSVKDKFELWDIAEEKRINEHTTVVINNNTNIKMIKKSMDKSLFKLHKTLSEIYCENIIRIYDVRIIDEKCVVLEEYIHGETLEDIINSGKSISDETAGKYMIELMNGLEKLHFHNIVHRDIKPSNIMIGYDGKLKIIDFDISRIPNNSAGRDTRILGTAGFAAPEQFGFSQTDHRSDIYSAGVLLNFMLIGKLPNEEIAKCIYTKIITRCIMIDPAERYSSVIKIKKDISDLLKDRKKPIKKLIRKIPGFRSGNIFFAFCAVYFYLIAIATQAAFINIWIREDFIMMLRILGRFQFLFTLPFLFYTDFLEISQHIPFIKKMKQKKRRLILSILGTASLIIGICFLTILKVPD